MATLLSIWFQCHRVRQDGPRRLLHHRLATVLALGFVFSPCTLKTLVFFGACGVAAVVLAWLTSPFFERDGRPSELETQSLMFLLLALAAPAFWADSEAVLPFLVSHPAIARQDREVDVFRARMLLRIEVDEEAAEVEIAQRFQPVDQIL